MQDLGWRDAIIRVLEEAAEPLHYTDITDRIVEDQLRTEFGATPARSVNATIAMSLSGDGDTSPFVRVGRGVYALRSTLMSGMVGSGSSLAPSNYDTTAAEEEAEPDEMGLINAFGMYWKRDAVLWTSVPKLLGKQQIGASAVNFSDQRGVYLLHDAGRVMYVGRTTEQPLGKRLFQHTMDRLNGRWDRFSWFGVHAVAQDGSMRQTDGSTPFSLENLIATMEALLIEGLEPPQNRKRGDDFRAVEFLQVTDPEIHKSKIVSLMDELKAKL
jgi:hypothetical protein